ncbi:type II CRISPR-associated endonuclease Cas1 [Gallibacterium anatis]|uniref:CRISPR-associated endonuclease Cas1 n=1 Tax=Gallibacterium anatis TaxID=750 RepID=A0A1A7NXV7_9PAST|nr:type II CRISPR-associated endonuclease Cas1 [Gallibacterium anatis]KGQ42167.1 CRISPR-associated protein Cas1 [Gallibacterium anatis IPDH697-78]OBW94415.1 CRISPR-associated protein Cas1 [Gallibacterium anatis]OBW95538.1 CRISPR-associated protein Cas1 [Gallibacterium anatis]
MSWRSIIINNSGKLSLENNQMLIQQKTNHFTVPLEDIAIIVIESREVVITVPLLSALAKNSITLLTCDEQYLPCGQWLPFSQYYRQYKILKLQLELSLPLKKQIWKTIIKQKIYNQAEVLSLLDNKNDAKRLYAMSEKVKSGDKDNMEAQAAVFYFQRVFGKNFKRWEDNHINVHLNYAYSILRSAIARALVQYGWLPALGIFHRNELNPFNLADDFIEPFRPLADLKIYDLLQKNTLDKTLTSKNKQHLISLLYHQILMESQVFSVLSAIDRCISSLQQVVLAKNPNMLKLPVILPIKEYHYE